MPKPYSYDLREKVIQAILLDGLKINEASLIFSLKLQHCKGHFSRIYVLSISCQNQVGLPYRR
jgi:transposase